MQRLYIDIEEEKTLLWEKVYSDFVAQIGKKQTDQVEICHITGTITVRLGKDGIPALITSDGEQHFFEEYNDDFLFDLYTSAFANTSPKDNK